MKLDGKKKACFPTLTNCVADSSVASIMGKTYLSGVTPDGGSNMPPQESTANSEGKIILVVICVISLELVATSYGNK